MTNILSIINTNDLLVSTAKIGDLKKTLLSHGLCGYFYKQQKHKLSADLRDFCRNHYKVQGARNLLYQKELAEFKRVALRRQWRFVVVKGMELLEHLYKDAGERSISDMDLLVDSSQLEDICQYLVKERGFSRLPCHRWHENDHKVNLSKFICGVEVVYELHTKLLTRDDLQWELIYENFSLSKEDHFLYLAAHLAYQHSYLKLSWSVDLYLYWQKYGDILDMARIEERIKDLNLQNTFASLCYVLCKYFPIDNRGPLLAWQKKYANWQNTILKLCLTQSFLQCPKRYRLRYYSVKHLVKEGLLRALKYDLQWLWSKGWK